MGENNARDFAAAEEFSCGLWNVPDVDGPNVTNERVKIPKCVRSSPSHLVSLASRRRSSQSRHGRRLPSGGAAAAPHTRHLTSHTLPPQLLWRRLPPRRRRSTPSRGQHPQSTGASLAGQHCTVDVQPLLAVQPVRRRLIPIDRRPPCCPAPTPSPSTGASLTVERRPVDVQQPTSTSSHSSTSPSTDAHSSSRSVSLPRPPASLQSSASKPPKKVAAGTLLSVWV